MSCAHRRARSAGPTPPGKAAFERRAVLGAFAVAASLLDARALRAVPPLGERTTTSPEGIVRTLLERAEDDQGNVFELILDTFPPGIVIPVHHHPAVGLNYVLSGTAESQYEGEPVRHLEAGDSFEDHANRTHIHFRNPDPGHPVMILIAHVLRKGQSFFIPGPV